MATRQDCQHEEKEEEGEFTNRRLWHLLRDDGEGNGHIAMYSLFLSQLPQSMAEHVDKLSVLP